MIATFLNVTVLLRTKLFKSHPAAKTNIVLETYLKKYRHSSALRHYTHVVCKTRAIYSTNTAFIIKGESPLWGLSKNEASRGST